MTEPETSTWLDRGKKFFETWQSGVTAIVTTVTTLVLPALPAVRALGSEAHVMLVGVGGLALVGAVFYAYRRIRKSDKERDLANAAQAAADKKAAEVAAELETERRRLGEQREQETARWPAHEAVKTDVLQNTNVGGRDFRNASKYGSALANSALVVLRPTETRLQAPCRIRNWAPFPVTLVGMRVEATFSALHGLHLKADDPNVQHAFKELAPGQSELVRVQLRAAASECAAADSAQVEVVGAVFVRSERWSGVEEAPISTSAWGIIVDERPAKPVFEEQVPPYRSPLQGGGF